MKNGKCCGGGCHSTSSQNETPKVPSFQEVKTQYIKALLDYTGNDRAKAAHYSGLSVKEIENIMYDLGML